MGLIGWILVIFGPMLAEHEELDPVTVLLVILVAIVAAVVILVR